jgi:hypothetical protein
LDRPALAADTDGDAPTSSLLPMLGSSVAPSTPTPPAASTRIRLRMAVDSGCWKCGQLAHLLAAQLRRLGIMVVPVEVANVPAAMRSMRDRIDLAAISTELPFPDPASFLTHVLAHDVPRSWVPAATLTAVDGLDRLAGRARDRAAVQLARRIAGADVPVVPYGAPHIGLLLRPQLGCRRLDAFDFELDLTTLCLTS